MNTSSVSNSTASKAGLWGGLAGVIVAALIAVPFSAAVAFATHPNTRFLFERGDAPVAAVPYAVFWWVTAAFLAALPFLVGYGVARLSGKVLGILGAAVAVFLIALIVIAQLVF